MGYLIYFIEILMYLLMCYHLQHEPRKQDKINYWDVPLCFVLFGLPYKSPIKYNIIFILYFSLIFMYSFKLLLYDIISFTIIFVYICLILLCYVTLQDILGKEKK